MSKTLLTADFYVNHDGEVSTTATNLPEQMAYDVRVKFAAVPRKFGSYRALVTEAGNVVDFFNVTRA